MASQASCARREDACPDIVRGSESSFALSRCEGDVLGGSALDMSQASLLQDEGEHDASAMRAPVTNVEVKEETDACDSKSETLEKVKRRRLMKGAHASAEKFRSMFQEYRHFNNKHLTADLKDMMKDNESIIERCQMIWQYVENKYPSWSRNLVRLGSAAVACASTRVGGRMFIGDNAFFLWLVEGDRFIRVHSGFCYIYNGNGAFQPYSGIPPQSVLFRVCTFFTQLEGIFRRMSPGTPRSEEGILRAIATDLARFEAEDLFLESCAKAAVLNQKDCHELDDMVAFRGEDVDEDREMPGPPNGKVKVEWTVALGQTVWKVCQSLRGDMMHDKLISLLVEWCETPSVSGKCVSYVDTCIQYDTSQEQPVQHIRKSALNNCYIFVPHPLLDPVLQVHEERLQKFYAQTFWANRSIFLCNQAALALAKRGVNVDRCFIGESPGGVGQSLFSLHLDSMLGHNHGFFDPNVWFNEDELRKQVETYARCIVITGQEAPESHKKLHLDLFKKTVSGDGIAGRKPYGYTTRMFQIVGWKRLEVNKMMKFVGIDDSNFQSVFRRSLVWKPKARFYHNTLLQNLHDDHESDGVFLADPSLKQFLASQPASAAGLKIQHAFETHHTQEDCLKLIEDYATGGDDYLTEDKMRTSCGLKLRMRHIDTVDAGVGFLEIENSQSAREESDTQFEKTQALILAFLLESNKADLTFNEFKKISMSDQNLPNMTKTQMWKDMQERQIIVKGKRRGTRAADVMQPLLRIGRALASIIVLERCEPKPFPETRSLSGLNQYLKEVTRTPNNDILLQHYQARKKKMSKPGRQSCVDSTLLKEIEAEIKKLHVYEEVCSSLSEQEQPAGRSPRRLRGKSSSGGSAEAGANSYSVLYHYPDKRRSRCRRYVHGLGAQMCAQRLQYHLYSHTCDLDISNACLCIVVQLLQKAQPNPPIPDDLLQALKQWVESRQDVCRDVLKVSVSEGKRMVNTVINGGSPPASLKDNSFVQLLQQASIYLRWFACSMLPDDFEELGEREDKDFPAATVFHYMWTAVEDYILEHWCNFLQRHRPTHLSLHFDGVRVNSDIHADMQELMTACEKHILESTGFAVRIIEKKHQLILDLVRQNSKSCNEIPVPDILLERGNCIPCGLWHLSGQRQLIENALSVTDTIENRYYAERGVRTYQHCVSFTPAGLFPHIGLPADMKKPFLLHCENGGFSHCVAVIPEPANHDVIIQDGVKQYKLPLESFRECVHAGIDKSTCVSFEALSERAELDTQTSLLLELQAGADAESEEEQGPAEICFVVNEEGCVQFQDNIRDLLEEEVVEYMEQISARNIRKKHQQFQCALCPFRSFHRICQLGDHVRKHHVQSKQFVCSGTKQMKVILALHDADCMQRKRASDLLLRSALLLQSQVRPALNTQKNSIDKDMRLIFQHDGPTYVNRAAIGQSLVARRVLNIYYDRPFAEILYREIVLHHSNAPSLHI